MPPIHGNRPPPPDLPAELLRLQHFLDTLHTLEADFVQLVLEAGASVPTENKGHISTAKPNRFRWDYHTPVEQTIVSNGQTIWFYEPDLEQVTLSDAKRLDDTPAILLSSNAKLQTLFTWQIIKDVTSTLASVRLFPRKSGTIQEIVFTLHPERDEILKLTTYDTLGHTSYFSFQNMLINQPVPEARFLFKIPPNMDIIQDYAQPSDLP